MNPAARENRREVGRGKSGIRHGYPLPNGISVEYRRPPKVQDTAKLGCTVWCARDSSNFRRAGRFLIDLPEIRGQRILRIIPVRERTGEAGKEVRGRFFSREETAVRH